MIRPSKRPGSLLLAAAGIAASLAPGGVADAGEHRIQNAGNYFELRLDGDWTEVTPADGPQTILVAYRNRQTGQVLSVTRVAYPNRYRRRKSYHDDIAAGFAAASTDFKRLRRKRINLSRVPGLDLVFRRTRGDATEVVFVRVLLFRTFSLTLTITGPATGYRRTKRRTGNIVTGFKPYFASKR